MRQKPDGGIRGVGLQWLHVFCKQVRIKLRSKPRKSVSRAQWNK